ncbi:hypothetical protein KI387_018578, partial [Taxus chinensis]
MCINVHVGSKVPKRIFLDSPYEKCEQVIDIESSPIICDKCKMVGYETKTCYRDALPTQLENEISCDHRIHVSQVNDEWGEEDLIAEEYVVEEDDEIVVCTLGASKHVENEDVEQGGGVSTTDMVGVCASVAEVVLYNIGDHWIGDMIGGLIGWEDPMENSNYGINEVGATVFYSNSIPNSLTHTLTGGCSLEKSRRFLGNLEDTLEVVLRIDEGMCHGRELMGNLNDGV